MVSSVFNYYINLALFYSKSPHVTIRADKSSNNNYIAGYTIFVSTLPYLAPLKGFIIICFQSKSLRLLKLVPLSIHSADYLLSIPKANKNSDINS